MRFDDETMMVKPTILFARPVFVLALAACVGCGNQTSPPPHPATRPAKWALVWADEFDGTTVDPTKWIVQNGAVNVNNELEYYTPSDVYLENGSLGRASGRYFDVTSDQSVWRKRTTTRIVSGAR